MNRLTTSTPAGLMQGRILNVRNLSAADEEAWRDLASRAVEPNPFYEPDCIIPAATHQSFGDEIQLVVAGTDDRFYACMPIRHVKRWRQMPYPIATTQVRRMTYLGTPLVDAEHGVEAVKAMITALARERGAGGSRVLCVQELTDGHVASLFRSAASELGLSLIVFESFERGFIGRHNPSSDEQSHRSKTVRNILRKQRNLLKELGGTGKVVDRGNEPGAIDDYISLEASGYKAENGVAMSTVPGESEYFPRYVSAVRCRWTTASSEHHERRANRCHDRVDQGWRHSLPIQMELRRALRQILTGNHPAHRVEAPVLRGYGRGLP